MTTEDIAVVKFLIKAGFNDQEVAALFFGRVNQGRASEIRNTDSPKHRPIAVWRKYRPVAPSDANAALKVLTQSRLKIEEAIKKIVEI